MQEVEEGGRRGNFGGMDVPITPESRAVFGIPCQEIGGSEAPYITPLVAFADAFNL